ncbi:MAG: 2-oxo acid dehydrogenase subunit E2, partial [Candidatus Heimdallarchaeota archaeon]|nr:2-oxo acid dehydrogenase subunit E2 [Candidatus Heimdallarchaeota archaeon]
MKKKSGTYTVEKIPKLRKILIENVERGIYYTQMDGLVEVDVTKALSLLKKHENKTGEKISFTGWIV